MTKGTKKNRAALCWAVLGGLTWGTFLTAALSGGCSGKSLRSESAASSHALQFPTAAMPENVRELWSKKMDGRITDLNLSENGSTILVTVAPDENSAAGHRLIAMDSGGNELWKLPLTSAVKGQTLSDDGKLAVISNYEEELFALDSQSGKLAWKTEGAGMCRPSWLGKGDTGAVLCYHDDDADPSIAFDLLDPKTGEKKFSFSLENFPRIQKKGAKASQPLRQDILALKLSPDGQLIALGLTQGQVSVVGMDTKERWRSQVMGEIIDLSISNGPEFRLAVQYHIPEKGQFVALLSETGKLLAETRLDTPMIQVEIHPEARIIAAYGNGPHGQNLIALNLDDLSEKWRRSAPRYADYSSQMNLGKELLVVGFEDTIPSSRHSHILGFDLEGSLKWNLPMMTEEGAYLYARGMSESASLLVVASDDGILSAHRIESP